MNTVMSLRNGDFFTLKDFSKCEVVDESKVWIRGSYDRITKRYSCINYADSCKEKMIPGNKVVFTDFIF